MQFLGQQQGQRRLLAPVCTRSRPLAGQKYAAPPTEKDSGTQSEGKQGVFAKPVVKIRPLRFLGLLLQIESECFDTGSKSHAGKKETLSFFMWLNLDLFQMDFHCKPAMMRNGHCVH